MLPPLATQADATAYGYTLPESRDPAGLLARASARVRRAAGRGALTAQTTTVRLPVSRGQVALPGAPILSVAAVLAVEPDGSTEPVEGWQWDGEEHLLVPRCRTDRVEVEYRNGFEQIPDGLVELVCQIAYRLSQQPAQGEGMIRQTSVDDYSVTYASEQIAAAGDLMPGELQALNAVLGTPGVYLVKSRSR
ncbi:hypothetical protein ABTZ57_01435 [Streptomyces sp. NPDC094048]|uniref:hypothetical protein n=1 Tax=unclassified Streptomyces TaxID=2593676 RepID=UPI0033287E07